jgi:8-oxo-dGTP diphosphatase
VIPMIQRAFQVLASFSPTRIMMRRLIRVLAPKNYVGAIGVVVNDRGQVLIAQHAYRTDYPWGLPGGWVSKNEDPAHAVEREIEEELGLRVSVEHLLICDTIPSVHRSTAPPHIGLAYLCRVVEGVVGSSHEIVSTEWIDPNHVGHEMAPFQLRAIEAARLSAAG